MDYWLSSGGVAGSRGDSGGAGAGTTAAPLASMSLATTIGQAVGRREKPGSAESVKYTVKAGFRWIVVQRLPNSGADSSVFTMTFGLKEKKQKSKLDTTFNPTWIMFLIFDKCRFICLFDMRHN